MDSIAEGGGATGEPSPAAEDASRRKFLHRMYNLGLSLWVGAALGTGGYVAGRYVWPHPDGTATGGERGASFPLAQLDELPMVKLLVEGQPVGVVRVGGEVFALGLVCTHLGCLVGWNPEAGQMICPCHASRFEATGQVAQGPAPAPLKRYEARISGDTVVVT